MDEKSERDLKTSKRKLTHSDNYQSLLSLKETEKAIKYIKDNFQIKLAEELNLSRVSAPVIVLSRTGINDYLSGVEKPVSFYVKDAGENAEIVQSLAKWKRAALADYGFAHGEGLYTDMNAIRPDENLDNLHSIYVDQWDWEIVMSKEERNPEFLKNTVRKIYKTIVETEKIVCNEFTQIGGAILPDDIFFIHSEELEERYPDLTPAERENRICEEKKAVFLIGIGAELKNGDDTITAWFTPEIPVSVGPGEFYGLPGLILIIELNGETAFMATSVDITPPAEELLSKPDEGNQVTQEEMDQIIEEKIKEYRETSESGGTSGNRGAIRR